MTSNTASLQVISEEQNQLVAAEPISKRENVSPQNNYELIGDQLVSPATNTISSTVQNPFSGSKES